MKSSDIPTIEVLKFVNKRDTSTDMFNVVDLLMEKFNAPEKLIYSVLERDERKGFIEYGTSLRYCWLTNKGAELLYDNRKTVME